MTVVSEVRATALADLPDRPLERQELLALATSLAADPEVWQPHVKFSDENRHYVSLHRDANVDVWVSAGRRATTPAGTTTTPRPGRWPSPRAS